MISLINIKCTESTEISPIAFFEAFIKKNKLAEAKANYISKLPNPNDPDDFWNRFPCKVNKRNLSFTVEYTEKEFEIESQEYKVTSKIDNYSFEGELEKLFREQFNLSTKLLRKKIESTNTGIITEKTIINYLFDKTRFLLDANNNITSLNLSQSLHQVFKRPYASILGFLYRNFSERMPDQKTDLQIGEVLKISEKSEDLYEKTNLSIEIIDKIFNVKDTRNRLLFPFYDIEKTKIEFLHFFRCDYHLMKSRIVFKSNIMAANYLIAKLAFYIGYSRPFIEKQNILTSNTYIFKLGSGRFLANLCDKDCSRISSRNPNLKFIIDSMFSSCLS